MHRLSRQSFTTSVRHSSQSRKTQLSHGPAHSYIEISRHFRQQQHASSSQSSLTTTTKPRRSALFHSAIRARDSQSKEQSHQNWTQSSQTEEAPPATSKVTHALSSLAHSIPSPHLRTKEELLASATSLFARLRIRFKWFTIRGFRPYRADDWSAFFSFFLGGMGLWIIVGTTSFMATVFYLLNSLQMQSWLAKKLGNHLTASSGVSIVFESAIVPKFSLKRSTITFKNVYISRGPTREGQKEVVSQIMELEEPNDRLAVILNQDDSDPATSGVQQQKHEPITYTEKITHWWSTHIYKLATHGETIDQVDQEPNVDGTDKSKWTAFHMSIDEVEVALSLPRWLDGKGLIESAVVKGVRGVIDRRHIVFDPNAPTDRSAYRHHAKTGDFHLEDLVVEDFLVTIYQPNDFRPYTCSIFSAHIPTLRKQWLFLDLMSAEAITGQVDNCLFSLHRPQSISRSNFNELQANSSPDSPWKRMSRFRIDGLSIDHFKSPRDSGFLEWILAGKVDLVADVRFPKLDKDQATLETIIGEIADRFDEVVLGDVKNETEGGVIPGHKALSVGRPLQAPLTPPISTRQRLGLEEDPQTVALKEGQEEHHVAIDLSIRFKEVKATIPLFAPQLSYVNNALIRPIVAFINANKTLIPVQCQVNLPMSNFDGSWTTFDTGILDAMSEQVYKALAYHVHNANDKRVKQVGLWSVQMTAQAVLTALRNWNDREGLQHTSWAFG